MRGDLHLVFIFVVSVIGVMSMKTLPEPYINPKHPKPDTVRFYPIKSVFKKADLIDRGCSVFVKECPNFYKRTIVCARHYDGMYKTFENYCQLEYENCNSWRQWSMIKKSRC